MITVTLEAASAGSKLSVVEPPDRPTFMVPPRCGPAAIAVLLSNMLAPPADKPKAAARPKKSLLEKRPLATCKLKKSNSFDIAVSFICGLHRAFNRSVKFRQIL
jgi:hypothetical protein